MIDALKIILLNKDYLLLFLIIIIYFIFKISYRKNIYLKKN